ncbi:hypothetical protein BSKO_08859 [Bryopsis sp. KO-2023]|nr:hypothetical protein BSKO_08859 [Bryopsis sp. KO-2023]
MGAASADTRLVVDANAQDKSARENSCSLVDLPGDSVDRQFDYMAQYDVRLAVRLSTASKSLQDRFQYLKGSSPSLRETVATTRGDHVRTGLEDAKKQLARCEPSLFVALWFIACVVGIFGARGGEEYSSFDLYPCLVLAYSVSVFSRRWPPNTARIVLLIFDFSLSYAGNIFITVQVNSSQTKLALVIALTSTVHALILSIWMMSVSVQTSPWRDLKGWFHTTQSLLMLAFYLSLTMYYEGFPGVWKLSSACCRLFMLVHLSWTWILPKVHEEDDGNEHQANGDVVGNGGNDGDGNGDGDIDGDPGNASDGDGDSDGGGNGNGDDVDLNAWNHGGNDQGPVENPGQHGEN